ncbi:FtsX-like permease family protein [Comamonas endophytica]|uniref:ABC transporter permease n=1 Tax=Comamonas endophytica TaxID=2949090 RepID=A0ABY6GBC1_9BURK|nr:MULTISPECIES: ABC transporter permease [unclassified Acidovorax]MCD2513610.1 ABC transporter permease [Acidovorax sp. D4N7]UYG52381.1 ABC transporter permease [Acidovorax sp. 5MLIR]
MLALLRTFSLQELLHHPWRTASALLAVVLGVALGFAVHVINASALDEFSRAVRSVQGQPDLELRAMQGALPEPLYGLVARNAAVARAAPWLEAAVQVQRGESTAPAVTLRLLGGDALQLAPMAPALMPRLFEGHDRLELFAPATVFLNAAALQALGLSETQAAGARLALRPPAPASGATLPSVAVRIAGTVAASGPPLAMMDIGAAQELLQRWGEISRIDLLLAPGADADRLLAQLRAAPGWPPGVLASVPGNAQQRVAQMSRAYRVNLTVLALVALFTGAFLVFSVLSLSVARRAPQFALLAVLGLTARQRLALVLAESALLGVLGSVGGIALGLGLAALALRLLGGDLGGGYFGDVQPALQWSAGAALAFAGLGLAATLAGGWWPARSAQRLPAAATLKGLGALQIPEAGARLPLLLLAASAGLAWLPPIAGIPLAAYVSVALLLLGGMAALPWLLGRLLARLPAFARQRPLWLLAFERARRMRASASVAVGGVVASLSLAVALTVMVDSFRGSMLEWLDTALPAPAYVRAAGGTSQGDAGLLDARLLQALRALPGVARAQPQRNASLALDARQPALALLVRPLEGAQAQALPWLSPPLPVPPGLISVHVSEAAAQLYGLQPGRRWSALQPAFPVHAEFFVAGIWRDYVRQFGAVAMDTADWQRLTDDTRLTEIALWPEPGTDLAALQARIQALAHGAAPLEWVSSAGLRERSMRIFDRSFAVTYWLQAVAIGIGLFGIAASFSAQVLARRKEFGLLGHLGLTRRQILGVVAGEGAVWSALGALAGTVLGLGVAVILVHVVNPQSFHWTMELRLPWLRLALLALAVTAAGTLAAWLAGRAAAGRDAVLAVKEDW